MSRAEEITSEVRKLVLTCRSLEAQLQQSVPKKFHQETVAKMQGEMDNLASELSRTKIELEKTTSIGQRIGTLEAQLVNQNETISSQSKTISDLSEKLSQNAILSAQYSQAVSKIQDLETKINSMVEGSQFAAVQGRCSELEQQVANMVPREQFAVLEIALANSVPVSKYEELQRNFEQMVPREQFNAAQARVSELERTLAESVPKTDFEDLASKIAQITKEAVELASRASAAIGIESVPAVEASPVEIAPVPPAANNNDNVAPTSAPTPEPATHEVAPQVVESPPTPAEVPASFPESLQQQPPAPAAEPAPVFAQEQAVEMQAGTSDVVTIQAVDNVPAAQSTSSPESTISTNVAQIAESQAAVSPTPAPAEIREVQTQLSEITGAIETGATAITPAVVDPEKGFRFSNSEFCARSGLEFLEDLEKVELGVLAAHFQNGDFERWFRDVLSDETSAQSLQKARESNVAPEELRNVIIATIAPKYRSQ